MENNTNIFGCFVSITHPYPDASQEIKDKASEQGRLFRTYILGEKGITKELKKLNYENYGNDLKLALFQFYVNPLPLEEQGIKEIESYRKKEKSIGLPIVIDDENFFSKSEEERHIFLKESILQKMDLLAEVIKMKKLDTDFEKLKTDLIAVLK